MDNKVPNNKTRNYTDEDLAAARNAAMNFDYYYHIDIHNLLKKMGVGKRLTAKEITLMRGLIALGIEAQNLTGAEELNVRIREIEFDMQKLADEYSRNIGILHYKQMELRHSVNAIYKAFLLTQGVSLDDSGLKPVN